MLLNVSKKTVKQIDFQNSTGKLPFNINNIDNYSLSDLKTLKENIERISAFGFNEDENVLEKRGPVLKKT